MDSQRRVEDALREEYFAILPEIRRALLETETRTRAALLEISLRLRPYERVIITARVKECDSAIDALRRRLPLRLFDPAVSYTLSALRDLAAVRVMAFPHKRFKECERVLVQTLKDWTPDPVPHVVQLDAPLALKYYGTWNPENRVVSEIQIVPLLVGLFWEVEHSAIYKPSPNLRGVVGSAAVEKSQKDVLAALRAFEMEFEAAIRDSERE